MLRETFMATCIDDIQNDQKQSSHMVCNGTIATCGYLKELCDIMKQYQDLQSKKNIDNILGKYDENIINIINYFHHLLECHDQKNAEFEYVYKLFGGNCPFTKCDILKRHYHRKRRESKSNHNLLYIQATLDQIHCHIRHQYDVGTRFTKHQLNDLTANENKIIENLRYRRLVLAKNINFETETSQISQTNNINNKFVSKKLVHTTHSKTYSYSYPFNYWKQCQKCNDSCFDGMTYSDLYIPPKYADLKEELLEHSKYFQFVDNPTDWILAAQKEIKTKRMREIKANCENYLVKMCDFADHPSKYGYKDGDILKINNIAVIKIYCGEDMFQNAFSKTYRAIDDDEEEEKKGGDNDSNESFESIKKRHREYHHFARLLRETVEVFGTEYMNGNIKRMYHGVRGEMLLPGFQCKIFGVLSTTFEYYVAVQFSCNNGLVLELVPDAHLKYFDCRFLSPWSAESELLFIGGLARFNIMNINCLYKLQSNHEPYVKALRVIDSMTNGIYFSNDAADIHKIKENDWCISTEELGFEDISNETKDFVKRFIDYRLSDKCNSNDGNTYVTKLLNKICDTKKCILINWASINHGKLEIIDVDGAYIGYKFVKSKICKTKTVGIDKQEICYIDIEKINKLFPSMISLVILELSWIESAFLDDILSLFENNKDSKIKCIELTITNDPLICTNIQSQFENYKHKFKNIKKEFSKKLETDKIVIKKEK